MSRFNDEFDLNPQTLFFEGDFGSIFSGLSGREARFDLPFTVGLFPLFLQNGIWANDAILGGAVSLPAKNSRKLGLPNYDITFFAAFDNVDNAGILGAQKTATPTSMASPPSSTPSAAISKRATACCRAATARWTAS